MATDWNAYLNREIKCSCTKTHLCDIGDIILEDGALEKLPALIQKGGFSGLCVLEDTNTKIAAGDAVMALLRQEGLSASRITLEAHGLLPDEYGIGSVLTMLPKDCGLLLAVGSGTINDLARFVSYKLSIPYYIIATAPSMDGFTSNVAAMITNHAKTTYEAQKPAAVIGDLSILAAAPMDLIAAGVGDVIGKYVCLTDWKLSNLITGEYFCPYVEQLVRESIRKVSDASKRIMNRDKQAVADLMEGLVLSGIAMSYIGNSRPASGSEHHLSHFWEMMFLQEGEHGAWHGTKVGVGTVAALRLYEMLAQLSIDFASLSNYTFTMADWEKNIQTIYGQAAPSVIALERRAHKNSTEAVRLRLPALMKHMPQLLAMVQDLPSSAQIRDMLLSLHAPCHPAEIAVDKQMFYNSIVYAKELRSRYGLLQILQDLGVQEQFAGMLAEELYDMAHSQNNKKGFK